MLAKNFYLCSRFCYPCFKKFLLFSPGYWLILKLWQFYLFCNFFEGWICQNLGGESNRQISVKTPLGTLFTWSLQIFLTKFCFQHKKMSALTFSLCCKNSPHYHIQLNNCTKPFINGHLWWVKFPKPPFRLSNLWRSFHLSRWPCLEGTVTRSRMDHQGEEERAFSSPQGFSQCSSSLKLLSISELFLISKASTWAMKGFCIYTSWSQVTETLQSLLHLRSFFLAYSFPFCICFWKFSGVGQSHQLWWCINPGGHMISTTAFIILPYALTCAYC